MSQRNYPVDDSLDSALKVLQNKLSKGDKILGSPPTLLLGLPVPSLAVRYLLQNTGMPLGVVYHLVGPPASFKSTLAVEIGRWHHACGGAIIICEAETKPTPALRESIIGSDPPRVVVYECRFLEEWQRAIIEAVKIMKDRQGEDQKPIAFIVDSYMGKLPSKLFNDVLRQGFAQRHFGEAAMLIGDWLSAYTSAVQGYPYNLIGVNHLKESVHPITGLPVYRTPGGQYLRHQNSIEIRVTRSRTEQKKAGDISYHETLIQLYTSKNCRGAQDKKIAVVLRQWNEVVDDKPMLISNFEWWEATTWMLYDGTGMPKADKEILLPKVKKILDIKKRARGDLFYCEQLKVPQSDPISAHDMGIKIEEQKDILQELYKIFGINVIDLYDAEKPLVKSKVETGDDYDSPMENIKDGTLDISFEEDAL